MSSEQERTERWWSWRLKPDGVIEVFRRAQPRFEYFAVASREDANGACAFLNALEADHAAVTELRRENAALRSALEAAEAALTAIEMQSGDNQCEVWSMERPRLRGRARLMEERLAAVYRHAHSALPSHSCYQVHDDWRAEVVALTAPGGGEAGDKAQ